jgi:hypothetical protein
LSVIVRTVCDTRTDSAGWAGKRSAGSTRDQVMAAQTKTSTSQRKPRAKRKRPKVAKQGPTSDLAKLMMQSVPDLHAAEAQLRRHVGEWLCAVRSHITALSEQVRRVTDAAKPGTVLGRLIDAEKLNGLYVKLFDADCAAAGLDVLGYDLQIPDLLAMRDFMCRRYPLAADGARLFAEPIEGAETRSASERGVG